jgi:hypothetical protein
MISSETPVLFAKACEAFIIELTYRAWAFTLESKRRTLQVNLREFRKAMFTPVFTTQRYSISSSTSSPTRNSRPSKSIQQRGCSRSCPPNRTTNDNHLALPTTTLQYKSLISPIIYAWIVELDILNLLIRFTVCLCLE